MWVKFTEEKPTKDSKDKKVRYLVKLPDCPYPVFGYFDKFSKRFSVFIPYTGTYVQMPVEWWMEIPPLPNQLPTG